MRAKIFFHGSCFDGAACAALFAAFYKARHRGSTVDFRPMAHSAGDPFANVALDGDDNACVDFRYCADPRMTWWFDHHVSAFQPRELREVFDSSPSEQKVFDPSARSCAILMERSLRETFEFSPEGEAWTELIEWADKIDGAVFANAREAVALEAPALEVMTWLTHCSEGTGGAAQTRTLIDLLGHRPLAEIARLPWLRSDLEPVLSQSERMIALIEKRATISAGVVFYDLTGDEVSVHNKFIAYMLHPDACYTVGLTCSADLVKISVGSNPWAPHTRRHNIAALCERFGGGGHPVVGGVSMPRAEIERAREAAQIIRDELAT